MNVLAIVLLALAWAILLLCWWLWWEIVKELQPTRGVSAFLYRAVCRIFPR